MFNMLEKLMITHFIADFVLQTRKMAQNKSSNIKYLTQHISIIFICFLPFGVKFALANALAHMAIDATLWNLYKAAVGFKLKKKAKELVDSAVTMIDISWLKKPENYEQLFRPEFDKLVRDFKYYEDPIFYDTIGLDQLLHVLTILICARYFL